MNNSKPYTETEVLRQATVNLDYCSLIENDGVVSLDELSELIPGFIHMNNTKHHGLEYISKKGLDIFDKSMDEIKIEGRDFLKRISDYRSMVHFATKSVFLRNNPD